MPQEMRAAPCPATYGTDVTEVNSGVRKEVLYCHSHDGM